MSDNHLCAICGSSQIKGKVFVDGEVVECYCHKHALRLKRIFEKDTGPGTFTADEIDEMEKTGKMYHP